MRQLQDRHELGEVPTKGMFFYFQGEKKKYSVVDFGEVMKSNPVPHVYAGWEAMEVLPNGELDVDSVVRGQSKGKLLTKLV